MKVVKPRDESEADGRTLFLAGSIDQGAAEDWQSRVAATLADLPGTIFNPRRDEWDSTLVQDISNPEFAYQVHWELSKLEIADVVLFYFSPSGPAPITLMELGTFADRDRKIVVCCPEGYWRRGNVQVFCDRYEFPLVSELGVAIEMVRFLLRR